MIVEHWGSLVPTLHTLQESGNYSSLSIMNIWGQFLMGTNFVRRGLEMIGVTVRMAVSVFGVELNGTASL